MTLQPQPSYTVHCPLCGTCQQIANPRPREVPSRILLTRSQFQPRISSRVLTACVRCGICLPVVFLYASEEELQELPPPDIIEPVPF